LNISYYFTRALESEFKGTSLSTCVFTPGAVRTNKNVLDRIERSGCFGKKTALYPEEVASVGINAMFKEKKVIIPGSLSRLFFSLGIIVPSGIILLLTRHIFSKFNKKQQAGIN
jgi:short-subunit dehydrogenase